MPRSAAFSVENNFRNGLITEASGLNFPESACTETYDCVFDFDGSVYRRYAFDYETDYEFKTINRTDRVVQTYHWKNVSGDGELSFVVVQVGTALYFYSTAAASVSSGAVVDSITISTEAGAPTPAREACQFASGNGLLFVTHPYADPFFVEYDVDEDEFNVTVLTLRIRDLEGMDDELEIDERPTGGIGDISDAHYYNLLNQGWNKTNLTAWDTERSDMPSNADVMFLYMDEEGEFGAGGNAVAKASLRGNTPAAKGHYLLDLFYQDRQATVLAADATIDLEDATLTDLGYQRASTCAFFAGRVFYAGINFRRYTSRIYFTQIVERDAQYAFCYQQNDPTSEDLFDLLPTDGGFIDIPEAGRIYKLGVSSGGLVVCAANGVWFISGSTGLGFTANDYTVIKISNIETLSAYSFVDVSGTLAWWNSEGINILAGGSGNAPTVQSITGDKIKTFYQAIPEKSKLRAKGAYDPVSNTIQWLYRSTSTDAITTENQFDRVLVFNAATGAFYPWTISTGVETVRVNSVVVTNQPGAAAPVFKYLCSREDGATHEFTFADHLSGQYRDWLSQDDEGARFSSYLISGYKLRGEGLKKFQPLWVTVFSRSGSQLDTRYFFQGVWDYAQTGNTGRWSVRQNVFHPASAYDVVSRRMKIRGIGRTLQYRLASREDYPFYVIGWASMDLGNTVP
jgi:hypothetical protein